MPVPEPTSFPSSPCPICGRPSVQATRPFCSKRCADVDLGRWFSGQYAVPGPPADPEDAEPDARGPARPERDR